jgi:hypothetical protein
MSDHPFASDDKPSAVGDNPYESPKIMTTPSDVGQWDSSLNGAAEMLRQTKPWVRFASIMTFIGSALMVLLAVVMMAAGAAGAPGMPSAVIGLVYLLFSIVYVIPAVYLWRYADRIGSFLLQRTARSLAHALEAQKSFWKYVGILVLVILCLYALIALVAIAVAIIRGAAFSI